jgi:hypothetical protein
VPVNENGFDEPIRCLLEQKSPASDSHRRRARPQRHGVLLFTQFAADKSQQTARRGHRQLSGAALRIKHKLVNGHI